MENSSVKKSCKWLKRRKKDLKLKIGNGYNLNSEIELKNIKIYTANWCPYCIAAKRFFDVKGWQYEEINIEEKGWNRAKLLEVGKSMTVPQIVIDGEAIGGYDELMRTYG